MIIIFKGILEKYLINISNYQYESINGYPLVTKLYFEDKNIIIKYLPFSKEKLRWLEGVYQNLHYVSNVSIPIRNVDGKFISINDDKAYILFECYEECNNLLLSSEWWGRTLSNIHSINAFVGENYLQKLKDTEGLLQQASKYMDNKTKTLLFELLKNNQTECLLGCPTVVNHGDPLFTNIMKKDKKYILIDFENSFLGPKEYDIQRHLWDYTIHTQNIDLVSSYWQKLKKKYEKFGSKVNKDALVCLYKIDFCRTLSWLHIVTQDKSRIDFERQNQDLCLFLNAIYDDRIVVMLESIENS